MDKLQNVSFWVDLAEKCDYHARICRDRIVTENKVKFPTMRNLQLWESGDMYAFEFTVPGETVKGREFRHHHVYANWARDGIWIDFHLSKSPYEETDRRLFLNFLNSVRFVPTGR